MSFPSPEKPGGMDGLLAINMLYTFIVAAMAVLVPLYLLDQKVDISLLGVILSFGPLSFLIIRIFLASMADEVGTRIISIIHSVSNLAAMLLYLFFISPAGFALATLAEGVRASGFWAIARTDVLQANGTGDPGKALARFSNMRQLADGAGRIAVGLLLAFLAFQGTLLFLLAASTGLLLLVLARKGRKANFHVGMDNFRRIFKARPKTFWYASLLQALVWLTYNMFSGFLLPVYLVSHLGLSNQDASLQIALLSVLSGVFAIAFMKANLAKRDLLLLSFLAAPVLLAVPFFGPDIVPLLVVLSVGMGAANMIAEYIMVDQVYRSKEISTDVGVLYAPLKFLEFLFLSAGGLVISQFGFLPLLAILAVSITLFVILGRSAISPPPSVSKPLRPKR